MIEIDYISKNAIIQVGKRAKCLKHEKKRRVGGSPFFVLITLLFKLLVEPLADVIGKHIGYDRKYKRAKYTLKHDSHPLHARGRFRVTERLYHIQDSFVGTRTDPSESLRRTHAPFDGTSKVQMRYFWKK